MQQCVANKWGKFGKVVDTTAAFVCSLNLASQMRGRQNGQAHCSHGNFNGAARSTLPKGQVRCYLTLVPWEIRTLSYKRNSGTFGTRDAEPQNHSGNCSEKQQETHHLVDVAHHFDNIWQHVLLILWVCC